MLKPARWNSCTVDCFERALRDAEPKLHRRHLAPAEKQDRAPVWQTLPSPSRAALMSTVSSSQSMNICCDREPVARRLALGPQRVARAAEEGHVAGRLGDRPRLFVHEADHQHFAARRVLHDRGNESVQFGEIHVSPAFKAATETQRPREKLDLEARSRRRERHLAWRRRAAATAVARGAITLVGTSTCCKIHFFSASLCLCGFSVLAPKQKARRCRRARGCRNLQSRYVRSPAGPPREA